MLRLLATLALLAMLALAQGSYGALAGAGYADNGAVLTAMHDDPGVQSQGEEHPGTATHGCHHSSCPPSFLVKARLVPVRGNDRSAVMPAGTERDPRSAILDRDPPVPRPLA